MAKRRSLQEIIGQADELADAFEQYDPSAEDLVQDVLAAARSAIRAGGRGCALTERTKFSSHELAHTARHEWSE
jgi:hypothetical protein